MFDRWRKRGEKHRAAKEQHAFDRRGGVQSLGYRFARPEEIVEDEGGALAGPGGSPEDPLDAQRCAS